MPFVSKPVITYGFADDAQVRAVDAGPTARGCTSPCCARTQPPLDVTLNLPGVHNVPTPGGDRGRATNSASPTRRSPRRWPNSRGVGRRFAALRRDRAGGRRGGALHADRRLRPPSGRDGRHAGGRARRLSRPPPRARVPAAPLHAHARPVRGFRARCCRPPTCWCSPRSMPPAKRRSSPPTAARWRARCASAGKVEPVFVETIADCPTRSCASCATATWSSPWAPARSAQVPARLMQEPERRE